VEHRRPITILLVEDNPDHALLTLRALKDGNLLNEIVWVKDGEQAIEYLTQCRDGEGAGGERPGLILLDIHLPKMNGHEVLRRIKSDDSLRTIPVVMLTTSAREDEVSASYGAGANSFVCKPVQFEEFVERVRTVKLYWTITNLGPQIAEEASPAER
jgi:CheY-like chemotaxis protein